MELSVWATAVGVVAGVLSVLIAIDQLTASARDRRLAEFLMRAAEMEHGPPQRAILVSLTRAATARLVARTAIPSWHTALVIIGSILVLLLATIYGLFSPEPVTQPDLVIFVATAVLLLGLHCLAVSVLISHIQQRSRIVAAFLAGRISVTREPWVVDLPTWMLWRGAIVALGSFALAGPLPYAARMGSDPSAVLVGILFAVTPMYFVVQTWPRRRWSHPDTPAGGSDSLKSPKA